MPEPTFHCTQRARDQIALRALDLAWIERTVLAPDTVELDPKHPDRTRAFRSVPERDGRTMRVVFVAGSASTDHVITASLDRGRRQRADEIAV